jgi:hypothetical protein
LHELRKEDGIRSPANGKWMKRPASESTLRASAAICVNPNRDDEVIFTDAQWRI